MVGRLNLRHLDQGHPQGPDVGFVVVRAVFRSFAHHHLRSHPETFQSVMKQINNLTETQEEEIWFKEVLSFFIKNKSDERGRLLFFFFFLGRMTHQYGVPMKETLLCSVLVFLADTPKSAESKKCFFHYRRRKIFSIHQLIYTTTKPILKQRGSHTSFNRSAIYAWACFLIEWKIN